MLPPLHPVLQLIITQPQLLLNHVGGYADWLSAEVNRASSQWRLRLILAVIALVSLGATLVLTGVAVMFAVMLPLPDASARWVLLGTPLLPLLLALGCAWALRSKPQQGILDQLKSQLHEDMLVFQEASVR